MPQYDFRKFKYFIILQVLLRNVKIVGCVSPSSKITEDLIRIKETKRVAKNVFNFQTRNWTFKTITGLQLLDIVNLKWIWHFYCIAQRSEKGIKVPNFFCLQILCWTFWGSDFKIGLWHFQKLTWQSWMFWIVNILQDFANPKWLWYNC